MIVCDFSYGILSTHEKYIYIYISLIFFLALDDYYAPVGALIHFIQNHLGMALGTRAHNSICLIFNIHITSNPQNQCKCKPIWSEKRLLLFFPSFIILKKAKIPCITRTCTIPMCRSIEIHRTSIVDTKSSGSV